SYDDNTNGTGLYIYNLKDGPISDIKPNIINITNASPVYTPLFLNFPPGFPKERSDQLWMMGALHEHAIAEANLDEEHWSGQIINDNEFKFDNSLIPMPDFKNFPQSGFTVNIVNNSNNSTLHVIGGLIYSKKRKNELMTNYHFKYDFNTSKWSDLSNHTKSILQPVAYHRVIQADDSLVLLSGLSQNYTKNGNFTETLPSNNATYIRISDIYKFDLTTEKWSLVNAKLNLDPDIYERGLADGLSLDIYEGKLLSYMSLKDFQNLDYVPKLGTLDFRAKNWEWTWIDVKNDGGLSNQRQYSKKIYSIDLKTNKLIGSVNISGKIVQPTGSGLPKWAIIFISIVCVLVFILILVGLWFYFRYKKLAKPNENNNQKVQTVWAISEVEMNRNIRISSTLNIGANAISLGQGDTTLNNETAIEYDYFQHE
ncbi:hypothetical protein CONCODRAFT_14001, partial [Conidiobolus coronatus NRRL 28638]